MFDARLSFDGDMTWCSDGTYELSRVDADLPGLGRAREVFILVWLEPTCS